LSRRLFGNKHRLEVALKIVELGGEQPHRLYKQALAKELGLTDAEIEKHLKTFRSTGMLERHPSPPKPPSPRGPGKPPVIFRPSDDPFWGCLQHLGDRSRRS
jgi:hypothetical protein